MECALRPRIRRWGRLGDYAVWLSPDSKIPTALVGTVWMCLSLFTLNWVPFAGAFTNRPLVSVKQDPRLLPHYTSECLR